MQPPSEPPPEPGGSSARHRLVLAVLVVALLLVVGVRLKTRRIDPARTPLQPDIVILHLSGLRADSVDAAALGEELGLDPAHTIAFSNAFAPSNDGTRSALSLLTGTLWLGGSPDDAALPAQLRGAGWRSLLVDDEGGLASRIGDQFDAVARVGGPELQAEAIRTFWKKDRGPRFVFVQVGGGDDPLHADTTESYVLRDRYRLRLRALRMAAQAAAGAATDEDPRPQLLALVGASGLELGEHPAAPDLPYDPQLRVPFLLGVKHAGGLAAREHAVLVQTADLTPTLLDMLDLRPRDERDRDGVERTSVSLEGWIHGWTPEKPHDALYFASDDHAAVRSDAFKLIAPLGSPRVPVADGAELYALAEDPAEVNDLLDGRPMGPTAGRLFEDLKARLRLPDTREARREAR